MKLAQDGIEYVTWTITADFTLDGTLEVAVLSTPGLPDHGTTWVPADWAGAETVETVNGVEVHTRPFTALLVGTAVDPVPALGLQLAAGVNYVSTKLDDNPEVIIRTAGKIEAE